MSAPNMPWWEHSNLHLEAFSANMAFVQILRLKRCLPNTEYLWLCHKGHFKHLSLPWTYDRTERHMWVTVKPLSSMEPPHTVHQRFINVVLMHGANTSQTSLQTLNQTITLYRWWAMSSQPHGPIAVVITRLGMTAPNGTLFPIQYTTVRLWSKEVHYIGNRVPFGTIPWWS